MSASLSRLCVVFGLMGFVVSSGAWGRTIYVDDDATADSDGSAWGQAYRDLQSALDVAKPGDEIRVAGGVYRPSKGLLTFASVRYATFSLISGVALRGGFAGPAGADPNARDVARFETILSGDLDGDDAGGQINGDNCFNVCTGDYTDPNAILDGFVIEGGAGGGWSAGTMSGGGLTIYRGRPTIANCTFRLNYAQDRGGAVVSYQSSGAFIDCTFVENTASWAGGAVEVYAGEPRFIGCDFIRNSVDGRNQGGAVFIVGLSRPEFTHCRFIANRATFGGAVKNEQSTSIFANCLFAGNRAYDEAYALLAASWEIGDPRSS
ncbi:MAG: right-handed parallel beta-helix repeat-containing protein, partial [Phycisphaerales bacterium]